MHQEPAFPSTLLCHRPSHSLICSPCAGSEFSCAHAYACVCVRHCVIQSTLDCRMSHWRTVRNPHHWRTVRKCCKPTLEAAFRIPSQCLGMPPRASRKLHAKVLITCLPPCLQELSAILSELTGSPAGPSSASAAEVGVCVCVLAHVQVCAEMYTTLLKLSFLRHRGPRVGEGGLSVHCAASLQHVYPWTVVCTSHALNFSFFGIQ